MRAHVATRPLLWDKVCPMIVEVGHADSDGTCVVHILDLGLVLAGDLIDNRGLRHSRDTSIISYAAPAPPA
ncbi:hypothetical protein [Candidatus Protofrankia datiscae]|nr:hypothetical protein [Candidatus Protofrankia datiscae]